MHLFVSKNNTLAPVRIPTQWLTEQIGLPFLMQTLPAHSIYLVLQTDDLQDNLELIEWIRGPQLQKILDFDIWEFNSALETEDISHHAAMSWIHAWLALGKQFAAERFFELEEETATLLLTKFFDIMPEGIAHITDDMRDNLVTTPDKRFFIQPKSTDGTDFEILTEFIDALYGADMEYAGFIFSTASLLIRQDTLDTAQKWRRARLADQGFIQKDEALRVLFSKHSLPQPLSNFKFLPHIYSFSEDATENTLNFISTLEPGDGVHLIKQILGSEGLKQLTGSQNSQIEHLYDDSEFIDDCVEYIVQGSVKIYHQLELQQLSETNTTNLLIEKVLKAFLEKNENTFVLLKQKIARISNTVASAMFDQNSYHSNTVNSALTVVRGCLNIGLEFCLDHADLYQLEFRTDDMIDNAVSCIDKLGVEYIFKIGFNEILSLQKDLLNFLFENKDISIKKSATAIHWLNSNQCLYSTEIKLVFEGLLNLLPMCHTQLLGQDSSFKEKTIYLSQNFKPFEYKSEVIFVQRLLQNIHHNLH